LKIKSKPNVLFIIVPIQEQQERLTLGISILVQHQAHQRLKIQLM